jgi:hypothetical protein
MQRITIDMIKYKPLITTKLNKLIRVKGEIKMSVPSWKRNKSKVEFLRLLMELNINLGKIVNNKPKKYKTNYGDHLIQTGLKALELAQIANSIYMTKTTSIDDYKQRRNLFLKARGCVEHISTASYIYLELCKNSNEVKFERVLKEEEYIGSTCNDIYKAISGVLKSDKALIKNS